MPDTGSTDSQSMTDPDRIRLLDALSSRTGNDVAELARRSGLAPQRIHALLGLLELEGAVTNTSVGWKRKRVV